MEKLYEQMSARSTNIKPVYIPEHKINGGNEQQVVSSNQLSPLTPLTPDFPIKDPELKAAYTKAFSEVYNSPKAPPVVTFDDIHGSLKYTDDPIYTSAYHIGQRKLILNEIQFLARIPPNERSLIVYAGAAPSNKGAMLASLFPKLKFLLIDPAPFEIRPYNNVVVTTLNVTNETDAVDLIDKAMDAFNDTVPSNICTAQVFMTGLIALELGRRFNVPNDPVTNIDLINIAQTKSKHTFEKLYFISDIRTTVDDESVKTFDIVWNSTQHVEWVTKMNPTESMLKFRTPFYNETDDELRAFAELSRQSPFNTSFDYCDQLQLTDEKGNIINYRNFTDKSFVFFDGTIYIQPWAPIESTETRLVFKGVPLMVAYNLSEYENKFFYYNKILRNYQQYQNDNANHKLGFDHCADCSLENLIWTDYCKSRGVTDTGIVRSQVKFYVETLSKLTYRPLLHDNHGKSFKPIPLNVLMHKIANYDPQPKKKFVRK